MLQGTNLNDYVALKALSCNTLTQEQLFLTKLLVAAAARFWTILKNTRNIVACNFGELWVQKRNSIVLKVIVRNCSIHLTFKHISGFNNELNQWDKKIVVIFLKQYQFTREVT